MAAHARLLPRHATPLELTLAEVNDPWADLADVFGSILVKNYAPPSSVLPFVVWQYGLGELSPYLPNLYNLISEGVKWQRVRGTPAAVYRALSWLGYAGTIDEEPARRLRWNRFQVRLDRVRDRDDPDLDRIEGVVRLSPPIRSDFFRGYRGYDVRAAETGYQKTSGCLLSEYSGTRLRPDGAKWSFGRSYDLDHTPTEEELTALGVWQEPAPTSYESELWTDVDQLWIDADWPWSISAEQVRRNEITQGILDAGPAYVRFRTAGGATIGFCRAVMSRVASATSGAFQIGSTWWAVSNSPTAVVVHSLTGFGDGAGQTAATASLVFGPTRAPGVKPGALWVGPSGLTGGVEIATKSLSIPFGLTVRERVRFLLRI